MKLELKKHNDLMFNLKNSFKNNIPCIATIKIPKSSEISDSKEMMNLIVLVISTVHILPTFC